MGSSKGDNLEKNLPCQNQDNVDSTKGKEGWITLPFIIGSTLGLTLAAGSWYTNLTMFLTKEYNIKNDVATRIYNTMNIGAYLFSILGAVFSDSSVGSFFVINLASFASLFGLIMLGLSTIIPSLRPNPCNSITALKLNTYCDDQIPTIYQYAFLIVALSLATIGFGCTRFLLSSLGAYQFNEPKNRRIFFNVYILAYEVCWAINYAIIGFVVQENNGSWKISFVIGISGNAIAIVLFLVGSKYFRHIMPRDNPIISKIYFMVFDMLDKLATSKARNRIHDTYQHPRSNNDMVHATFPNKSLRFPSQESPKCDVQRDHNGIMAINVSKALCKNLKKEADDDFRQVIKVLPIWSANIILNTIVATITNLIVRQASTMNLTLGAHFKLPAGSTMVMSLIFTTITVATFDIFLFPIWQKVVGQPMKPLQRGGAGHVLVVLGVIGLAVVEMTRLDSIKQGQGKSTASPMSAMWLLFPLALLGVGVGYYFPGGLTFHYQEFPDSLKSTSTALPSLQTGIGFYLSKTLINLVKRETSWLPSDINFGRLDRVYWILALVLVINFGYFLICAIIYKYNNNCLHPYTKPVTSTNNIIADQV